MITSHRPDRPYGLPLVWWLVWLPCFSVTPAIAEPLSIDFDGETAGRPPAGWASFTPGTTADVSVVAGGPGASKQCLRGRRSEYDGLVAAVRRFGKPRRRIAIEFSFAFAPGPGRSLNTWTFEPEGRDASQFNLCIQNGALQQYDGRSRSWRTVSKAITPSTNPDEPVWQRLRAVADARSGGIDFWLSKPGDRDLPAKPTATLAAYRTDRPFGGLAFVSGRRIAAGSWYLVDDLVIEFDDDLPAPADPPAPPQPFRLWTGLPIPQYRTTIPFVPGVRHHTMHAATEDGYKFLHGAAIVEHAGVFYANWANSPTNENGPSETLQGRRSRDGGRTWSDVEVIGPGFDGPDRHSHGVLFVHEDRVWTICARFGVGKRGRRFPGLRGEAFVLDPKTDRWESRGIVMQNCWPYDAPVRLGNGNRITGGQDRDGLPVVAISHGDDLTRWDTVSLPYPPELAPSFAETTVETDGKRVLAVIRGGGGRAWVSTSDDHGRTWSRAQPSNFPMPRAKAYLGRLSSGEPFLLSNLGNRDTLVIAIGRRGSFEFDRLWRIRHGPSTPPRFPGRAKAKQWSYPYGYEHDGHLYVVYSIGKEDGGLSILPLEGLIGRPRK